MTDTQDYAGFLDKIAPIRQRLAFWTYYEGCESLPLLTISTFVLLAEALGPFFTAGGAPALSIINRRWYSADVQLQLLPAPEDITAAVSAAVAATPALTLEAEAKESSAPTLLARIVKRALLIAGYAVPHVAASVTCCNFVLCRSRFADYEFKTFDQSEMANVYADLLVK